MRRRDFILTVSSGAALLAGQHSCSSREHVVTREGGIDPLVPFRVLKGHESVLMSQIKMLRSEYGLRRFTLLGPSKGIRYSGFPNADVYKEIGQQVLSFKEQLANYDIEVGWESESTIKQGPGAPYQYITNVDGRVSEISFCPLDPSFRDVLAENVSIVARIAHPFLIQMEDDFTLRHAGGFGCFCPLHLQAFAERVGRLYSRDSLFSIFREVTPESIRLRREWAIFSRDSLAGLAAHIRASVDRVSPETRISLCQAGNADAEGDFTEAVTRAFAGKTRPAVRLYGADYGRDHAEKLPEHMFHALYSAQHLPEDFELYHETDTFPHTRFFISNAKIKSLMTTAFAYGLHDSRFYVFQATDNSLEENAYARMYREEVNRFNALKHAVKDCRVEGCEIVYDPFEHTIDPVGSGTKRYAWANVTGRLGIPHTASNGKVKMLSGNTVQLMTNEQVTELLKGGVFLDGKAAHFLSERGFADLIGAEVSSGGVPQFMFEGLRNPSDYRDVDGYLMYNFLLFGSVGTEGGSFYKLKPIEGTEIVTDFLDHHETRVCPGTTRYENRLGGRVAITAFDLSSNSSSAIINYKKKEVMKSMIEWLGKEPLPVFVRDLPNMFCIFNKAKSGKHAVVVLTNLCNDSFDSVRFDVDPQWQKARIDILDKDGMWRSANVKSDGESLTLKTQLNLLSPVILRLTSSSSAT